MLALLPVHPAKAEQIYCLNDLKCYNQNEQLKVFGFLDGKYYNLDQQEVWLINGNFVTTNPNATPLSGGLLDVSPAPAIGTGIATSTPAANSVIVQQPAITPVGSAPILLPLYANICSNFATSTPQLPLGYMIVNGQCVPQASSTLISNVKVVGQNIFVDLPAGILPKISYSTSTDMSNATMQAQARDKAGNTLDTCLSSPQANFSLSMSDILLSNTTYYFQIKQYECGVPNFTPSQLYLGQSDINSFKTP